MSLLCKVGIHAWFYHRCGAIFAWHRSRICCRCLQHQRLDSMNYSWIEFGVNDCQVRKFCL